MLEEKSIIKATGTYGGYSAKGNFDVDLKMVFSEDQLSQALEFLVGIRSPLSLLACIEENRVKLGVWNVYSVSVDRNLQTKVSFRSRLDNIFVDNLSDLMSEEKPITICAKIK